jgi:hypothetical protein
LADLPSLHLRADGINSTNHFVTRHPGKGKARKLAVYSYTVGVANPARLYAKSYLPRAWMPRVSTFSIRAVRSSIVRA